MDESDRSLPELYVQPGESRLVTHHAVLRTVLGSCVGITFQDPRLGIGALCHPMLPNCLSPHPAGAKSASGMRYVDCAIRTMASELDELGAIRAQVVVKLFGGNDVLTVGSNDPKGTIGTQNAETALRVLAEEGFRVAASCLGGTTGVHITFDTSTGEVILRRLDSGIPSSGRKASGAADCVPGHR